MFVGGGALARIGVAMVDRAPLTADDLSSGYLTPMLTNGAGSRAR
jgi:hypothetical protein